MIESLHTFACNRFSNNLPTELNMVYIIIHHFTQSAILLVPAQIRHSTEWASRKEKNLEGKGNLWRTALTHSSTTLNSIIFAPSLFPFAQVDIT